MLVIFGLRIQHRSACVQFKMLSRRYVCAAAALSAATSPFIAATRARRLLSSGPDANAALYITKATKKPRDFDACIYISKKISSEQLTHPPPPHPELTENQTYKAKQMRLQPRRTASSSPN